MADSTKIEWTDATWNPVTGCSIVSPGCTNCYAMKQAGTRLAHHPSRAGLTQETKAGPVWNGTVRFNEAWLTQPLRWKRPRMVFVCAHSDLFHEDVPDEWIDLVFAVMALCPQHTFQILTKRSARMRKYMAPRKFGSVLGTMPLERIHMLAAGDIDDDDQRLVDLKHYGNLYSLYCDAHWPLPNVWLGVSAEDQRHADERIPDLLNTPAAIRFVSAEPLLGPIDFRSLTVGDDEVNAINPPTWLSEIENWRGTSPNWETDFIDWFGLPEMPTGGNMSAALNWIIVGGESGPAARPMHPDWARSIRDQCAAGGVPFFFKQWGSWAPQFGAIDLYEFDEPSRYEWAEWTDWDGGDPRWDYISRPQWCDDLDPEHSMVKVGKERAGRLLDGVEHNAMPRSAQ